MEWWKKSCIYQIYPKSFQDSNGDGIGDIKGIQARLPYLKTLGVDILWITPMYSSPQKDNGYDIANYYEIDPMFGTMEDFDNLLTEAHNLGLKIMMDIVVNHTSTKHVWFQDVVKYKDKSKYKDFYILKEGNNDQTPNNWESMFGGSAWEPLYDNVYYLHAFDNSQADLNWECEELRKEIHQMMHFWLKKGVDGFRLDVINLISKQQDFLNDEISSPKGKRYYANGPRMHEFLKEMQREVFSKYPCVTVGEMMSMTPQIAVDYTHPKHKEVDMIFSFQHLKVDYAHGDRWTRKKPDIKEMIAILNKWQLEVNEGGGWNSLVWSNHDQPRVVSRFGHEGKYRIQSAKMLATAMHCLKGTPYIYQGEEIGMLNAEFSQIDKYKDIETLHIYEERLRQGKEECEVMEGIAYQSRDNARTPLQWNKEAHNGFTTGIPWISCGKHQDICVQTALKNPKDVFYHYQKLINLRKESDILAEGTYSYLPSNNDVVWAYMREYQGEKWVIVSNFSEMKQTCNLQFTNDEKVAEIILSNYEDSDVLLYNKELRPYESIVYRMVERDLSKVMD